MELRSSKWIIKMIDSQTMTFLLPPENHLFVLWCFQVLWKSYIDFEIEQEEFENTRNLYRRLLQRTQHVKVKTVPAAPKAERENLYFTSPSSSVLQVWISYAKFELSLDDPERLHKCREVFEEANKSMRHCEMKEERLLLLESWRDFEREFGTDTTMERVRKLLPEKVKKRRKLTADDGVRSLSTSTVVSRI